MNTTEMDRIVNRLERRKGIAAAEDYLWKLENQRNRRWSIAVICAFVAGLAVAAIQ